MIQTEEQLITTSIRLSPQTMAALDDQSSLLNTTRSSLIRGFIEEMIERWVDTGRDVAIQKLISRFNEARGNSHNSSTNKETTPTATR